MEAITISHLLLRKQTLFLIMLCCFRYVNAESDRKAVKEHNPRNQSSYHKMFLHQGLILKNQHNSYDEHNNEYPVND